MNSKIDFNHSAIDENLRSNPKTQPNPIPQKIPDARPSDRQSQSAGALMRGIAIKKYRVSLHEIDAQVKQSEEVMWGYLKELGYE